MSDYDSKLNKVRKQMFDISKKLKQMFDSAFDLCDEKFIAKTIETIKNLQKKCYKIIDRKNLHDNHGGTYKCYPGGGLDVFNPHTDKQNIIDMIDYFFINDCESPEEFNKKYSKKLHSHEFGESYGFNEYSVESLPKEFYESNCWEQILLRKDRDLINQSRNAFSQKQISEINKDFSK